LYISIINADVDDDDDDDDDKIQASPLASPLASALASTSTSTSASITTMSDIFDEAAYRHFAENLRHALSGPNIRHVNLNQAGKIAKACGTPTSNGAWCWRSMISTRIGPRTVYLGSKRIRLPNPSPIHNDIIASAPDELHKVLQLVRTLPMVHIRRRMGSNSEYNPTCNLYVSINDRRNARLAYMWGNTVSDPDPRKPGPEFTMIHIPEEHQIRQQVLALPEYHINIALGTDYMGEDKKGFLRQAMWFADEHGMLGLHAGTKMVTIKDKLDGRLKRYGVFLFGLSATGKSTWSCHRLGLNESAGESTEVIQDDIVFLRPDGSAFGSEANFFVKTDVDINLQEAMYWSLVDKTALYENVMVDYKGKPDFLDESLCANGRAVIRKDKLRVRRGKKLVRIDYEGLNMPPLDELDGIIFAFITRRNTMMTFSQELTAEQAVLAYLWGESSHSYASQPSKAGESVRTVGTDPFIVGSRAHKVNRFRDIVMTLCQRFPGKVRFFQYNTGGVGEIIEEYDSPSGKKKKIIRKVTRVPIPLMASIQRGDLQGTSRYEIGRLGTKEVAQVEGFSLSDYDPKRFYSDDQINAYIEDIIIGRRRFTDEITQEGLDREIIKWAEKSYDVLPAGSRKLWRGETAAEPARSTIRPVALADTGDGHLTRPPRSLGWRLK
ncbi:MAG: phosphoenolpyruvate carboxykinase (ATP), partial [Calditrichota bacterium]